MFPVFIELLRKNPLITFGVGKVTLFITMLFFSRSVYQSGWIIKLYEKKFLVRDLTEKSGSIWRVKQNMFSEFIEVGKPKISLAKYSVGLNDFAVQACPHRTQ